MPIYEFECAVCGRRFEDLVSLSADLTKVRCPKCGKKRARKLPSVFATSERRGTDSSSSSDPTCPTGTCSLSR